MWQLSQRGCLSLHYVIAVVRSIYKVYIQRPNRSRSPTLIFLSLQVLQPLLDFLWALGATGTSAFRSLAVISISLLDGAVAKLNSILHATVSVSFNSGLVKVFYFWFCEPISPSSRCPFWPPFSISSSVAPSRAWNLFPAISTSSHRNEVHALGSGFGLSLSPPWRRPFNAWAP